MALWGKKLETDQRPKKVSHPVSKHRLHLVLPKDNLNNLKSGAVLVPFVWGSEDCS